MNNRTLLLLALGTFALGMDAFIVAGLIPDIAAQTGAEVAAVGQLVTVFTLCYAVAGPLLSSVLRADAKTILLTAIVVFTLGNVASALAGSFGLLLVSRAVAGIGAGLYSPNAAATAAALVPAERRGHALSVVLAGLSIGTVVGVPIGLLLAGQHGWRSAFWFVSAVGLVAAVGVAVFIPRLHIPAPAGMKARLATVVDSRVTPIVAVSLMFNIASLGLYTYLAEVLRGSAGITDPTVYLWIWGIGGIIGALTVGKMIDRVGNATRVMPWILVLFAVSAAVLIPAGTALAVVAVALAGWGAAGFASPPPQQHLLLERAPDRGAVAVAVNGSAIYLGSAIGSALFGYALHAGVSAKALPPIAAVVAGLALLLYLMVVARPHR